MPGEKFGAGRGARVLPAPVHAILWKILTLAASPEPVTGKECNMFMIEKQPADNLSRRSGPSGGRTYCAQAERFLHRQRQLRQQAPFLPETVRTLE